MANDPFFEIGKERNIFRPLGKIFFNEENVAEYFRAFGTSFNDTMQEFANSIKGIISDELKDGLEQIVKALEKASKEITSQIKNVAETGKTEIDSTAREISDKLGKLSEDSIKDAVERFKEAQEYAQKVKEKYDELLPKLEKDADLRMAMVQQNFPWFPDPRTGEVVYNVGGKRKTFEEITTKDIQMAAGLGQLTSTNFAQGGGNAINTMVGFVQPIVAPTTQMIGTVAPSPMEKIEMGRGLAGGLGSTLFSGGMALTAAGVPAGPIVAIAGALLSGANSIIGPIVEAFERRRVEIERRESMFGWGAAGPMGEAEQVYRRYANIFYPTISKEQIQELTSSLLQMGTTMEDLSERVKEGATAMNDFGLSVSTVTGLQTMLSEQMNINPQRVNAMMGAAYMGAGLMPGTSVGAGERVQIASQLAEIGYQYGFSPEEAPGAVGLMTTLASTTDLSQEDITKLTDYIFSPQNRVLFFGTMDLTSLSKEELAFGMNRAINWITQTMPYDMLIREKVGISETGAAKLRRWSTKSPEIMEKLPSMRKAQVEMESFYNVADIWAGTKIESAIGSFKKTGQGFAYEKGIEGMDVKTLAYLIGAPDEMINALPEDKAVFVHGLRRELAKEYKKAETGAGSITSDEEMDKYIALAMESLGISKQELSPALKEYKNLGEIVSEISERKAEEKPQTGKSVTAGTVEIKLAEGATQMLFDLSFDGIMRYARAQGQTKAGE